MEASSFVKEISVNAAKDWIKEGALVVDVREKEEVEALAYDVPDIVNIPLSVFEHRYEEIPRDREVVMVCKGGGRSLRATAFLVHQGYTRVVNMQGGIMAWVREGLPTKGDASTILSSDSSCCSKPGCC